MEHTRNRAGRGRDCAALCSRSDFRPWYFVPELPLVMIENPACGKSINGHFLGDGTDRCSSRQGGCSTVQTRHHRIRASRSTEESRRCSGTLVLPVLTLYVLCTVPLQVCNFVHPVRNLNEGQLVDRRDGGQRQLSVTATASRKARLDAWSGNSKRVVCLSLHHHSPLQVTRIRGCAVM